MALYIKNLYTKKEFLKSIAQCSEPLLRLWQIKHPKSVEIMNSFIEHTLENVLTLLKKYSFGKDVNLYFSGGLAENHPKII